MMPKPDSNPAPDVPFTKVPKSFFTCVMPDGTLSGAEIKIILAVINKTAGYHKEEDSISYSQFCKATGLALSTVEVAVKKAVGRGYISWRPGKKYKGLERIYKYTPPEEKARLSTIKGGKSNNEYIMEML